MGWTCIIPGKEINDVRSDRRGSKSVEKYNISNNALYFDTKYLPISEIKALRIQPSIYTPQGCCGKGIPVFKIRVEYGAEKPVVLMVEKEKNAQKAVEYICAAGSNITVEEYKDPASEIK